MSEVDFDALKVRYPNLFKTLNDYYGIDRIPLHNLEELIEKNLHSNHYVEFWKNGILKTISEEIGFHAYSITFGFIPNYGGEIQFSTEIKKNRYEVTKIQFYMSLLDNIYTIQILETTEIVGTFPNENLEFRTSTLKELWVSPENHPKGGLFLKIQNCLESLLENPVFLPHSIQNIELKDIIPPYSIAKERYFVRDAFFRTIMPQYSEGALVCGNPNYLINKLK